MVPMCKHLGPLLFHTYFFLFYFWGLYLEVFRAYSGLCVQGLLLEISGTIWDVGDQAQVGVCKANTYISAHTHIVTSTNADAR